MRRIAKAGILSVCVVLAACGKPEEAQKAAQEVVDQALMPHVEQQMNDINQKVASDAVEQFNMVKRNGDKMEICVQAGMVSAAYLQAKDEANYSKWKQEEKVACAAAGLPAA